MNDSMDIISVIMATYNSSMHVREALLSIANQNIENERENVKIELCIHDDCSTDNTLEIIEEFLNTTWRSRLFSLSVSSINKGAANARNEAIKNCRGNYFCIHDR